MRGLSSLFHWRRSSRRNRAPRRRFASYGETQAAVALEMSETTLPNYDQALAAPRLPYTPPHYEPAPPTYPPVVGGPDSSAVPTYAETGDADFRQLDGKVRALYTVMFAKLARAFELPVPDEREIGAAGSGFTRRGRELVGWRRTHLMEQANVIDRYRQEFNRLEQEFHFLEGRYAPDAREVAGFEGAFRFTSDVLTYYVREHKRLKSSAARTRRIPLPNGDVPFARWGK